MCDVGILRPYISDHNAIFCVLYDTTVFNYHHSCTKRNFCRKKNISKFWKYLTNEACANIYYSNLYKALNKYEWDLIYSNNYQITFSNFQSVFSKCFMNNFPMKTTKIQYKNRLPYITSGLRKSIQYKHILRHIYAKNLTDEIKQKCRTFNIKLTSLLRKREQDYIEEQLDINKADMSN